MQEELRKLMGRAYPDLYTNSATFYHTVNTLAAMLPSWVDALAEEARIKDEHMKVQINMLSTEMFDGVDNFIQEIIADGLI